MKTLLYIAAFSLLAHRLPAQQYFEKTWGDTTRTEKALAVRQLPDGSVYVLGYDNAGSIGNADMTVTKLDSNGNILWARDYGTTHSDAANNFLYHEGVFYICGETHYTNGNMNTDAFIQRIDTAGNNLGLNLYGGATTTEQLNSLTIDSEGRLVAVGFKSDAAQGNNVYILRFEGGNFNTPERSRSFGTAMLEVGAHILPLADSSGYMVVGDQMQHQGHMQAYVLRLDNRCDLVWEYAVPFAYNGGSKSAILNAAQELVIIGEAATATSTLFDVYFVRMRTDTAQVIVYTTIPASDEGEAGFQILQRHPDNYVAVGYGFNTQTHNMDILLSSIDASGNEVARKLLGGAGYDMATGLCAGINGGLWIAGVADGQYFLAYQTIADTASGLMPIAPPPAYPLAYPNPARHRLHLPTLPQAHRLWLYNMQGQPVGSYSAQSPVLPLPDDLPAGLYLLVWTDAAQRPLHRQTIQIERE